MCRPWAFRLWRGLFKAASAGLKAPRHSCPYASPRGWLLLHVLEPLLEKADDVVIVGDVVDVPAGAARFHEPHAAEQTQLMGDGGLGESEKLREVAHRHLGAGEGVEDPHTGGVAKDLEGLGQGGDRRLIKEACLQLHI